MSFIITFCFVLTVYYFNNAKISKKIEIPKFLTLIRKLAEMINFQEAIIATLCGV